MSCLKSSRRHSTTPQGAVSGKLEDEETASGCDRDLLLSLTQIGDRTRRDHATHSSSPVSSASAKNWPSEGYQSPDCTPARDFTRTLNQTDVKGCSCPETSRVFGNWIAVPAGTKGMMCQVGFGGEDPRTGEYYSYYASLAGGYGGRIGSDGSDAVQTHMQNTQNAAIEETELNYPVRITRYRLIPDSEGPGRFRGGLGLCREYLFPDHKSVFTTLSDRARFAPHGLFGGEEGKPARYLRILDGQESNLSSKATVHLAAGETVRIETCGGGGYGPPLARDPELVRRDAKEEKISPERARERYGVAIRSDGSIDPTETDQLRSRRRSL